MAMKRKQKKSEGGWSEPSVDQPDETGADEFAAQAAQAYADAVPSEIHGEKSSSYHRDIENHPKFDKFKKGR